MSIATYILSIDAIKTDIKEILSSNSISAKFSEYPTYLSTLTSYIDSDSKLSVHIPNDNYQIDFCKAYVLTDKNIKATINWGDGTIDDVPNADYAF